MSSGEGGVRHQHHHVMVRFDPHCRLRRRLHLAHDTPPDGGIAHRRTNLGDRRTAQCSNGTAITLQK